MAELAQTTPIGLRPTMRVPFAAGFCVLWLGGLVVVLAQTTPSDLAVAAAVQVVAASIPLGLGLYRLSRRADDRFARQLVGAGLLWSTGILAESGNPTLYSVGRTVVWLVEPALVYLILAFPSGRLTTGAERVLFRATVLAAGLLYLPTALLAPFPTPSPWAQCGSDCPHNALAATTSTPAVVDHFVRPLRETLTVLLFAAVAVVIARRANRAGPLMGRTLAPVAAIAIFRAAAMPLYFVLRTRGHITGGEMAIGWVYLLSLPALTLAFAGGLLSQRLFVARALERLTAGLRSHATPADVRVAMADALADPDLQVLYRLPGLAGRWVDETGRATELPHYEGGRMVTEVTVDGRRFAAIDHDAELAQDPVLIDAAASYALTALENDRLSGALGNSLRELAESRARLVAVADGERRKIERDLHDGAQQHLVALRVKLELQAELLDLRSPEAAAALRELEEEVDATIDEVRSFARGIYPSLLADRGLGEALQAAGRSAPLPTVVDAARIGRYPPEIEATVYFACAEALQNAAKHADGASGVTIKVSANGGLRFEVRDDGAGFSPLETTPGVGLTHLRDRLAAVGGTLEIDSAPGSGTTITGVIPVG